MYILMTNEISTMFGRKESKCRERKKEGNLYFLLYVWQKGWEIEGKKEDMGKVVNKIVNLS